MLDSNPEIISDYKDVEYVKNECKKTGKSTGGNRIMAKKRRKPKRRKFRRK